MSKVTVSVEVSKSADAIGRGLVDIVRAAKAALADGWQPGQDVPSVLMTSAKDMLSIVSALGQVPADVAEDKVAFLQGMELHAAEVAKLFL